MASSNSPVILWPKRPCQRFRASAPSMAGFSDMSLETCCVSALVNIYIYIYIYIYISTHVLYVHIHVYIYEHIAPHIIFQTNEDVCVYIMVCIFVCMYMYLLVKMRPGLQGNEQADDRPDNAAARA